jgi:hypothetical protein
VFAGFSYDLMNFYGEGGATADDVFVIPITARRNPGFMFVPSIPWIGIGLTAQIAHIRYSVQVSPGGTPIVGASLSFQSTVDLPLRNGKTMVEELVCSSTCYELLVDNPGPPNEFPTFRDVALISPSTDLRVSTRILADGVGGTAVVSLITQQFRSVPEPSTCLLLASGLLAGALRRVARRRRG